MESWSTRRIWAQALLSAAKNAVEDNMPDYLSELKTLTEGSFLEGLDELNLEVEIPQGGAEQHWVYAAGTLRP